MKNFRQLVIAYLFAITVLGVASKTVSADVEVVTVMAIQLQLPSTGMDSDHQQLTDMLAVEYSADVKEDLNQRLSVQMNVQPVTAYLL